MFHNWTGRLLSFKEGTLECLFDLFVFTVIKASGIPLIANVLSLTSPGQVMLI